ncbi:MAG: hypothetical protein PHG41_00470 [Actinomycetota bacterium]|nr:hypothetical protein [Actinomycetota bacterium]
MKKILYLPIETIVRELNARLLLAHQALSRGYSVIIGEKHNVLKAAEILKSGVYFYKSHGASNFPKEKKSDKAEFKFVSLDEEGLVFVNDNKYLINSKPHELEHLDIVFTWGSYQRDLLIKENPDLEAKTIPVGNPRFDLLRPEFRVLYESISNKIRKKWGKYILINTNFAPGNYSRLYGCSYVESRVHQFYTITGRAPTEEEKSFLIKESEYYKELFERYVEMIKEVSPEFPDINFILRPHPSEDIINWKQALKGLDNVHVIFKGNAVDWIIGSQAVIHTGCTTGIESWALGKIVIAYNPNKKEGIEPQLPNKFGVKLTGTDDLYKVLADILDGNFNFKRDEEQLEIAKSYIESITGDYSVTRFLDALDNIPDIKNAEPLDTNDSIFSRLKKIENTKGAIKIKILKLMSRYQPVIKKVSGRKIYRLIYGYFDKYPGLFAQFKKFPGLKPDDIKNKLYIYDEILYNNPAHDYIVKKIATDTYLISKK